MRIPDILARLESAGDPSSLEGMARVGITPGRTYGVRIPHLRALAREIGRSHDLALELWKVDARETRILAGMVGDPKQVTGELMDRWTSEFDYWEICDQTCMNLFEKTPMAWEKAVEYAMRDDEFVKRTGFVLMARLAVCDKKAADDAFRPFFPLLERGAADERNMVKKAVNWALRQLGKRNLALNERALESARRIQRMDSPAARWVAADAIRELSSEAVRKRFEKT